MACFLYISIQIYHKYEETIINLHTFHMLFERLHITSNCLEVLLWIHGLCYIPFLIS